VGSNRYRDVTPGQTDGQKDRITAAKTCYSYASSRAWKCRLIIHCISKKIPNTVDCNLKDHQILIIFSWPYLSNDQAVVMIQKYSSVRLFVCHRSVHWGLLGKWVKYDKNFSSVYIPFLLTNLQVRPPGGFSRAMAWTTQPLIVIVGP